jgi:hypothetical protein
MRIEILLLAWHTQHYPPQWKFSSVMSSVGSLTSLSQSLLYQNVVLSLTLLCQWHFQVKTHQCLCTAESVTMNPHASVYVSMCMWLCIHMHLTVHLHAPAIGPCACSWSFKSMWPWIYTCMSIYHPINICTSSTWSPPVHLSSNFAHFATNLTNTILPLSLSRDQQPLEAHLSLT